MFPFARFAGMVLLLSGFVFCPDTYSQTYFTTTNASWKYFKGRSEASSPDPTAWRRVDFNDASWGIGGSPFYYSSAATEAPFHNGGAFGGTVLDDMLNSYTTVFFRNKFAVTNVADITTLILDLAMDDGCIVWLNGTEILRTNVSSGTLPYSATAASSVAEPVPVKRFTFPNSGLLTNGTNVLCVQGFNQNSASSDFGFMAGLSAINSNCQNISEMSAWWMFEGNTADQLGTNTLLLAGGASFASGEVGQALTLNGSTGFARAPGSDSLNIGTAPGFTIECWINPANAARMQDIVEWNESGSIGVHVSTSVQASRDLYANIVDTAGVSHQIYSDGGVLLDNTYQHIAVTYDRSSGAARLYLNGTLIKAVNLGSFVPRTTFPFFVGTRPAGVAAGISFQGGIDELSLYRRVLSGTEIQSIFDMGTLGKCATPLPLAVVRHPSDQTVNGGANVTFSVGAQGAPPLRYAWLFNEMVIPGATQSALNLANVGASHAGEYRAVVSDVSGSLTSNPARLVVILPLTIVTQPQSAITEVGVPVTFTCAATGSGPLAFQWYFQGAPLPGATSSSLTLGSPLTAAGRYFVTVSDTAHSVTSAVAVLTILSEWSPVLTEFMAQNNGPVTDEDGEYSDWIEIHNPTSTAVNLGDWCLTDDLLDLTKWRFPGVVLPANGYLLVFASGKDRIGAELHTNFRLDADGGYLAFVKPDGATIVSQYFYSSQRPGVSFGLAGSEVFFPDPSPRSANNPGVFGFVRDTKFDTNRGVFFAPFDLVIRCGTPGATLVVTTNGDVPTLGSGVQVSSVNATSVPQAVFRLSATTVVRAAAFKEGYVPAGTDTHTFIFPSAVVNQTRPPGASPTWIEDPPGSGSFPADFTVTASVVNSALPGYSFTNALISLPTISLVSPMDGLFGPVNGIYTRPLMEGTNWEREVSIELIYPDGREGFHTHAGAQMHGDVSALPHTTPKHPLRLFFRQKYGPAKLAYPLFPGAVNQFDQLILRSCSTDSWPISNDVDFLWRNYDATYQRDQWMRDSQLAMGQLSSRGIYVHLYLNGVYWGVYNLTERINDSFAADHLGGQKEEYDVIQGEIIGGILHVATAGTDATWIQLLQMANQVPGNPAKYWEIQGLNADGTRNPNRPVLLDLDNFIDYMLLHIYAPAVDWPNRNWWALRRRDSGASPLDSTGFKFLTWDQEVAIDRLDRTITWYNNQPFEQVNQGDTPAQVYDRLRGHPEFKLRFADRLQKHLFSGVLTVASNRARWAARAAEIDRAMVAESARWGDAKRNPAYTRETDWLRLSNFTQNVYWPSNETLALRRFRNVGLYPSTGAPMFSQPGGPVPADFLLALSHTNATGTILYTLDGNDPRAPGGAVKATALAYTQPIAIVSPTLIRARVNTASGWSALVEAQFYPPQDLSKLQLSEIMYNPPRFGTNDGDEVEFFELKNTGSVALDLSGLRFTRGLTYDFPNETQLGAGGYFVLARNATEFSRRYPGAPLHGIYSGKLDNNGENLTLSTALGASLFSVTYNNAAPWPAEADNTGFSLQRMTFATQATNPAVWIAMTPTPGEGLPSDWLDSDGDGLPDGWERTHGLSVTANDADADPDDDGLSNLEEFVAGSNPQAYFDSLRIEIVAPLTVDNHRFVQLGFIAYANKTYTVSFRDPANGTVWTRLENISVAPTDRWVTVVDSIAPGSASRFYRLASPKLP